MKEPEFNLEQVYDDQIAPLMAQIIAICKEHKMPMIAAFNYFSEAEGKASFCTTCLARDAWQPDEIKEAVRIIRNGASTRPKVMAMMITTANPPRDPREGKDL